MFHSSHVGLTSYSPCGDPKGAFSLPADYIDAVADVGLEPSLLVGGDPRASLETIDGLLLSGGGDIDPGQYGGEKHETNYMVDPRRDSYEIELTRCALASGLPILAICRGMQILNVATGGTLVAHVPERFGSALEHRAPPREPVVHRVQVPADSRLSLTLATTDLAVMSWHHQAVDRLGTGLRVAATAADGVIEAVEFVQPRSVIAVQWHPELKGADDGRQRRLFAAFAECVQEQRRGRS